jgi:hypothetical protein
MDSADQHVPAFYTQYNAEKNRFYEREEWAIMLIRSRTIRWAVDAERVEEKTYS